MKWGNLILSQLHSYLCKLFFFLAFLINFVYLHSIKLSHLDVSYIQKTHTLHICIVYWRSRSSMIVRYGSLFLPNLTILTFLSRNCENKSQNSDYSYNCISHNYVFSPQSQNCHINCERWTEFRDINSELWDINRTARCKLATVRKVKSNR